MGGTGSIDQTIKRRETPRPDFFPRGTCGIQDGPQTELKRACPFGMLPYAGTDVFSRQFQRRAIVANAPECDVYMRVVGVEMGNRDPFEFCP